jgi:phage terminase Nu1 subunit (DNA packaging protein)
MATVAEVADWLGLSGRRVKELRADGVLPGGSGEAYDIKECVRAYCAHMRPSSGKAAGGGSEAAQDLDAARVRLLTAQADAREMLNAQMRGEAVLAEDLDVVVGALVDGIRAKMLGLPSRAAPVVSALSGLVEIREALTELVHEACGDLARTEVVGSVTDRARRRASRNASGNEDTEAPGAAAEADA